jgi:hypothetical protein
VNFLLDQSRNRKNQNWSLQISVIGGGRLALAAHDRMMALHPRNENWEGMNG